jgi:cytochrome o ubiquinol oxidase subunit III
MSQPATLEAHHHDGPGTDVFGFWIYILTDCVLFGSLFATFIVLNYPGAYGPQLKEFIQLPYVLTETFLLLGSNFTFGLAMMTFYKRKMAWSKLFLLLTIILGAGFVLMEINEFYHFVHEGYSWQVSGAASAFYGLVATHGLHVSVGLLWILVMIIQLSVTKNVRLNEKRMIMLGIFWNFLDIVWIFVFTTVYLQGAL